MITILADHCIPPSLVRALRENGVEVVRLKEISLEKAPDEAVFKYARKKSLPLFTFDHHFGDITRFKIKDSPGVIIFYVERMTKQMIFKKAVEFFKKTSKNKLRGWLYIFEPDEIRIWPKR